LNEQRRINPLFRKQLQKVVDTVTLAVPKGSHVTFGLSGDQKLNRYLPSTGFAIHVSTCITTTREVEANTV
jgi:hypothetical protein